MRKREKAKKSEREIRREREKAIERVAGGTV